MTRDEWQPLLRAGVDAAALTDEQLAALNAFHDELRRRMTEHVKREREQSATITPRDFLAMLARMGPVDESLSIPEIEIVLKF